MVLKLRIRLRTRRNSFENDVEMYGAQTCNAVKSVAIEFENDVEMYGAQTTFKKAHD